MAKEIKQKPRESDNTVVAYFRIPINLRQALYNEAVAEKRSPSNMLDVILSDRYGVKNGKARK